MIRCRCCGMPPRLCSCGRLQDLVDLTPAEAEDDDIVNMLQRDALVLDEDDDE